MPKNFSKLKNACLLLILLVCARGSCTTVVFLLGPNRITGGADRLVNSFVFDTGTTGASRNGTKITLLRGRFIVACVGFERFISTTDGTVPYDFPEWTKGVESQINPDTSVPDLASIVERESSRTFSESVPIEKMMQTGAIKYSKSIDKYLVQFLIAGYDNRVPTLIQIYYELDWKGNHLIGPERKIEFPIDGANLGIYSVGINCGIDGDELINPNSYSYKRLSLLAPSAFKKMLALQETLPEEAVTASRGLLSIEAEIEPQVVGGGSIIVVLPFSGGGSVTEYQTPITLPEPKASEQKQKK